VIGVGHSIGAMVCLMAAIERPKDFRALVLIEPVLWPPLRGLLIRLQSPLNLIRSIHPLIRRTLKRKRIFPTREAMFTNYRKKQIFRAISDDVLRDYVEGLTQDLPDGSVELKYSPDWEARIYETSGIADGYVWGNLCRVRCPVVILRGERSQTFRRRVLWMMQKLLPDSRGFTLPAAGHLVPLESPYRTAQIVLTFLDSI
jgi:pimeloyl-ACP methyl ester carboxylesterase